MEVSVATIAPVILRSVGTIAPAIIRSILTFVFFFSDKALKFLADRSNLFKAVRHVLVSSYLFSLRVLPSFILSVIPNQDKLSFNYNRKLITDQNYDGGAVVATDASRDSGIGRALCQVLFLVNETPVNSRKYEVVRALAEKLIHENLQDGNEDLMKINCSVLSMAFSRTLNQLEVAMIEQSRGLGLGFANGNIVKGNPDLKFNFSWITLIIRTISHYIEVALSCCKSTEDPSKSRKSAEKFAAELLWLAEKMAVCRCGDDAVHMWASASNLAWLSLVTEPRLQGSIVKISAFLFKQAKVLEREETKVKMLMLWIPLICRGSMGTDSPLLSVSERKEIEKVLGDTINSLEHKDDQEQVLALWLHHYTCCPSSDWPNLHDCYTD